MKIKGRLDGLIIRGGLNIYPAEIENAIRDDQRVKAVVVFGDNNKYTAQICMKIAGDFKNIEEVRQMCTDRLPRHQIPAKIELVKELPQSGSGKIVRGY